MQQKGMILMEDTRTVFLETIKPFLNPESYQQVSCNLDAIESKLANRGYYGCLERKMQDEIEELKDRLCWIEKMAEYKPIIYTCTISSNNCPKQEKICCRSCNENDVCENQCGQLGSCIHKQGIP
jgi:hypothetical protein